jgi:hypothetical protein
MKNPFEVSDEARCLPGGNKLGVRAGVIAQQTHPVTMKVTLKEGRYPQKFETSAGNKNSILFLYARLLVHFP